MHIDLAIRNWSNCTSFGADIYNWYARWEVGKRKYEPNFDSRFLINIEAIAALGVKINLNARGPPFRSS